MRRLPLLLAAVCLSAGCSSAATTRPSESPSARTPGPSASAAAHGSLPTTTLHGLLLQLKDLPSLTERREFASADLTTQATPQLSLCSQDLTVPPHELASVLAKPLAPGPAQVFELVAAFSSTTTARRAFDQTSKDTSTCSAYSVGGASYRVADLSRPRVTGAGATLQYRLTTPGVVGGDVRTVALRGRFLVLVTGYGTPPAGQTLLTYQAAAMGKALARLPG